MRRKNIYQALFLDFSLSLSHTQSEQLLRDLANNTMIPAETLSAATSDHHKEATVHEKQLLPLPIWESFSVDSKSNPAVPWAPKPPTFLVWFKKLTLQGESCRVQCHFWPRTVDLAEEGTDLVPYILPIFSHS